MHCHVCRPEEMESVESGLAMAVAVESIMVVSFASWSAIAGRLTRKRTLLQRKSHKTCMHTPEIVFIDCKHTHTYTNTRHRTQSVNAVQTRRFACMARAHTIEMDRTVSRSPCSLYIYTDHPVLFTYTQHVCVALPLRCLSVFWREEPYPSSRSRCTSGIRCPLVFRHGSGHTHACILGNEQVPNWHVSRSP